ncbi:hypothetical protein Taro_029734 [Colocasia esculenta]|uniref:MSP domain-containing protein n=1 Tax=Colocasia esculenta TaxID=4460 RepID=A0A843VS10_COLES|nr:hypothetical protein [Colocasia esculenta]
MEKLVEVAEQEVVVDFQMGVKCRATVNLKSLHPTAYVAFKVQTSSPHKFLVNPPSGLLSPLSAATFQVILKPQSQLPSPLPRSGSDRFLIKAAVVLQEDLPSNPDAVNAWFSARPHLATQDTRLKVVYAGALLLRHAVSDGDADAVRQILRRQKSLVSRLGPGESISLLRSASTCRDPAVLNLLVEAGWKAPKQKAPGPISTISSTTIGSGISNSKEAAQGKPSAGVVDGTAAASSSKGWTPLHSAAASGSYDALVRLMVDSVPQELDRRDGEGRTPLHLAIIKGHIRCVRALLERGADRNARSNDGRTPLHKAAALGAEEMVALLLDMGADPSILTARGRSPLDVARDKGHQEVVEILERGEMVLTAARRGEVKRLESLLRKGLGANGRDQYGMTALHSAAVKGHRDVVRLLAEFGAELECQDVEGHTPLHLAVEGGCVDTVEALIDLGADVNAKSRRGATPLYMARSMGYDAVSQLLVSRGAASSSVASSSNSSLSPALLQS